MSIDIFTCPFEIMTKTMLFLSYALGFIVNYITKMDKVNIFSSSEDANEQKWAQQYS